MGGGEGFHGEEVIAVFAYPAIDFPGGVHEVVYLLIPLIIPVHTNQDSYSFDLTQ